MTERAFYMKNCWNKGNRTMSEKKQGYKIRYADLGSVSSGTMSTDDLLDSLSAELDYQLSRQSKRFPRKTHRALIREANRLMKSDVDHQLADSSAVVDDLFEALSEFAPPFCTFGAHIGDGADYGYWFAYDNLSEVTRYGDALSSENGGADIPKGYRGEWFSVSDHGNLTLYVRNAHGKDKEIWSIV